MKAGTLKAYGGGAFALGALAFGMGYVPSDGSLTAVGMMGFFLIVAGLGASSY